MFLQSTWFLRYEKKCRKVIASGWVDREPDPKGFFDTLLISQSHKPSIGHKIENMAKLRPATQREAPIIKIRVAPESWRFTAYCFFWSMCIFAIMMSKIFVIPLLARGPEKEGDVCGPFNRVSLCVRQSIHQFNENNE